MKRDKGKQTRSCTSCGRQFVLGRERVDLCKRCARHRRQARERIVAAEKTRSQLRRRAARG